MEIPARDRGLTKTSFVAAGCMPVFEYGAEEVALLPFSYAGEQLQISFPILVTLEKNILNQNNTVNSNIVVKYLTGIVWAKGHRSETKRIM